jgi:hypothetical protein
MMQRKGMYVGKQGSENGNLLLAKFRREHPLEAAVLQRFLERQGIKIEEFFAKEERPPIGEILQGKLMC